MVNELGKTFAYFKRGVVAARYNAPLAVKQPRYLHGTEFDFCVQLRK
jgi:hypothetical protein